MGRGGFEPPTHGFSVRCGKNISPDKTKTYTTTDKQLTLQLTPKSQKQPQKTTQIDQQLPEDLAEIVTIWPKLPEHIKAAIKALIQTYCKEAK